MDEWRVDIRRGLGFGIALMVFIFFVDVGLIWLVADRRLVSLGTFVAGLALLVSLVALGLLGYWCGLLDARRPAELGELLRDFDISKLPHGPTVYSEADERFLLS